MDSVVTCVFVLLQCGQTFTQLLQQIPVYANVPEEIPIFDSQPSQFVQYPVVDSAYRQSVWTFGACRIVIDPICPDPDVTFFLYTRNHPDKPIQVSVGSEWTSNITETDFDPSKPVKIVVHGYNSNMHLSALTEIRKEYLKTKDYNVFTVDWGPLAMGPCYPGAVYNAKHVGSCAAQLVRQVKNAGAQDIHVIGFSLGAHVTNYMAVSLRPYLLPRITGLDPALPGFITINNDDKLDKSDARFVDVYHTNAFIQGKVENSGHVDFYINGGVIQPGCWAENRFFACNHHRAPLYFAESINTEKGFWGWPCPSYFQYLLGRCPPIEPQIIMGENVNRTSTGTFLVITESVSPFAVGKYTGPAIEIFYKKSESNRHNLLTKYHSEVMKYVEDYSVSVKTKNDIKNMLNDEFAESIFEDSVSVEDSVMFDGF